MGRKRSDRGAAITEHKAGRPRSTTARDLELVALDLFAARGFNDTTVEDIAVGAGVSRRTFFRYFESKAAVLWHGFDEEVDALRTVLATMPDSLSPMQAVRRAVVEVNAKRGGPAELRLRMELVSQVPALQMTAVRHYDDWEAVVARFIADRLALDEHALIPRCVGRTTLAACRAAYEQWLLEPNSVLADHIDDALAALARGFAVDDAR